MKNSLARLTFLLFCGAMLGSTTVYSQEPANHQQARAEITEFFEQYKSATTEETAEKLTNQYDFEFTATIWIYWPRSE